jgi:hypothetical protein
MNGSNIINDFTIEDDVYTNILNLYIQHYKRTYPEKTITSLFDGINVDDYSSTNHMLETLYEEMLKYNNTINVEEYESNLYGLSIDGNIIEKSNNIIKLLLTINQKYKHTNWFIVNLK